MCLSRHHIRYLLIILGGILLTCKGYAMEQKFIVTYKVLTSSQLENLFLPEQANLMVQRLKTTIPIFMLSDIYRFIHHIESHESW